MYDSSQGYLKKFVAIVIISARRRNVVYVCLHGSHF